MDVAIRETLGDLAQEQALELSRRLWREPVWDLKIVAGRILSRKSITPDVKVWGFVTEASTPISTAGRSLTIWRRPRRAASSKTPTFWNEEVETWIENPHLWTRRAALVFSLPWAKEKRDPDRMLGWAARLAESREWFIQKAIGWWLRELSKRDPERVRRFLADHGERLTGVARREAGKYLAA